MDKQYCIFDMDGTLTDSMHYWKDLGSDYLHSKGISPDERLLWMVQTMTMTQAAQHFMDSFGLPGPPEQIIAEIRALRARMEAVLSLAPMRTCFSLLEQAKPPHVQELLDMDVSRLECIVTDSAECFTQMERWMKEEQQEELSRLSFYSDSLPLVKLYSLESVLKEALGKRVWLKSGGYLVIEPTEALTVVDVNTGKYTGKKNVEDTIFKINTEAAIETARQLRLRNLSGIIIVDFIDMASEENRERLLAILDGELKKDPIKTVLVEMTRLGLVEITRKKVRKPLYEAAGTAHKKHLAEYYP